MKLPTSSPSSTAVRDSKVRTNTHLPAQTIRWSLPACPMPASVSDPDQRARSSRPDGMHPVWDPEQGSLRRRPSPPHLLAGTEHKLIPVATDPARRLPHSASAPLPRLANQRQWPDRHQLDRSTWRIPCPSATTASWPCPSTPGRSTIEVDWTNTGDVVMGRLDQPHVAWLFCCCSSALDESSNAAAHELIYHGRNVDRCSSGCEVADPGRRGTHRSRPRSTGPHRLDTFPLRSTAPCATPSLPAASACAPCSPCRQPPPSPDAFRPASNGSAQPSRCCTPTR